MTSWLRVLGLHVVMLGILAATVVTSHVAVAKPDLPLALLDSFDEVFARVYDAAERKVTALETTDPPASPRPDVFALLREFEGRVAMACDTAFARLDAELAVAASLSPARRTAVLGCIERHLGEARTAAGRATDPDERAEYEATCERLREVRRMSAW
jgi:hypothetical protein